MLRKQGAARTAIGLANRWFQPLTHVSDGGFPRVSAVYVKRVGRGKREGQRFGVAQSAAQSVLYLFSPPTSGPGHSMGGR
jgi:hypothetical protein